MKQIVGHDIPRLGSKSSIHSFIIIFIFFVYEIGFALKTDRAYLQGYPQRVRRTAKTLERFN